MMTMNSERTIQIQLTREQELQIAAATGLLIGTLELDLTETPDGEIVAARIPQAMVTQATGQQLPTVERRTEALENRGVPGVGSN